MATNPNELLQQQTQQQAQQQPNGIAGAMQTMAANTFGTPNPTTLPANNNQPAMGAMPLRENQSVQERVVGLIDENSDYMKRASQSGIKQANARGLTNSSIAAGAAMGAAIDRAAPIAQADANIAAQTNLSREDQAAQWQRLQAQLASSDQQQQRDIAAQMERLNTANQAEMERLQSQLANSNEQQRREIEAQMDRLRTANQAEMDRLTAAAGFDMDRLNREGVLNIERDAAQARNAQDLARVQGDINSRLQAQGNTEQMQRMNLELQNQLQINTQQNEAELRRIAASGNEEIRRLVEAGNQERVTLQQNIAAQDRQQMAQQMVNIFQIEAQMRAALLSNTNIPASERAAYERAITSLGDPIRQYLGQLYGPQQGSGGGGGFGDVIPPPPAPAPAPPPSGPQPNAQGLYNPTDLTYRNGRFYLPNGTEVPRNRLVTQGGGSGGGGGFGYQNVNAV